MYELCSMWFLDQLRNNPHFSLNNVNPKSYLVTLKSPHLLPISTCISPTSLVWKLCIHIKKSSYFPIWTPNLEMKRNLLRRFIVYLTLFSFITKDKELSLAYLERIYSFSPLGYIIPCSSLMFIILFIIMFNTFPIFRKR